ncbi:hypothetical protein DFH08DRAFT_1042878 [Mycena albidolilacea]|uniref:Uncharacterized protein n=1 Tax=Mycena albidolilacea TaxID=1033008 RepID=A0AAD7EYD8_9AGAR|nr:hypothetical protein DFH08DRAFT_1042878 [Mycena albidolilacea]
MTAPGMCAPRVRCPAVTSGGIFRLPQQAYAPRNSGPPQWRSDGPVEGIPALDSLAREGSEGGAVAIPAEASSSRLVRGRERRNIDEPMERRERKTTDSDARQAASPASARDGKLGDWGSRTGWLIRRAPVPPRSCPDPEIPASFTILSSTCKSAPFLGGEQRATVHGSERPGAPRALRAALRPGCPYVPDGVDLVGAKNAWLFEAHPQSSPSPLSGISAPKLDAFVYRDGGRGKGEDGSGRTQAAAPPHLTTESVGEWAGDGRQSQAKSKKEAGGGRRGHAFCLEKDGSARRRGSTNNA